MEQKAEEIKEEPKVQKPRKVLDWNAVLNLVSYPLAGLAGFYAFKQNVRKDSVEYHTKLGNFDKSTAKMMSQAKEAAANGGAPYGNTVQEAMATIREKYEDAKSQKFQKMGYKSVVDNWKDIADNNKMEAITTGFTVAAITLGALLMVANSKEIFKPLFKDEGADKDKGAAK